MISDAASYVTDKIAQSATERFAAAFAWAAVIGIFVTAAVAFALVAGYLHLAALYGSFEAATMLAGCCLLVALLAWMLPKILRSAPRMDDSAEGQPTDAMRAVEEEARDVVDYFGSAKVLATAFMFGFSAARRIKS